MRANGWRRLTGKAPSLMETKDWDQHCVHHTKRCLVCGRAPQNSQFIQGFEWPHKNTICSNRMCEISLNFTNTWTENKVSFCQMNKCCTEILVQVSVFFLHSLSSIFSKSASIQPWSWLKNRPDTKFNTTNTNHFLTFHRGVKAHFRSRVTYSSGFDYFGCFCLSTWSFSSNQNKSCWIKIKKKKHIWHPGHFSW